MPTKAFAYLSWPVNFLDASESLSPGAGFVLSGSSRDAFLVLSEAADAGRGFDEALAGGGGRLPVADADKGGEPKVIS